MSTPAGTAVGGKSVTVESEGTGSVSLLTHGTGKVKIGTNDETQLEVNSEGDIDVLDGSLGINGNLVLSNGDGKFLKGIQVKEGTNASMGRATLSSGAVTVATTEIGSASEVMLSVWAPSGTLGNLSKQNVVAGVSFDIVSTSAGDNSTISWLIVEPL